MSSPNLLSKRAKYESKDDRTLSNKIYLFLSLNAIISIPILCGLFVGMIVLPEIFAPMLFLIGALSTCLSLVASDGTSAKNITEHNLEPGLI